MRAKIIKKLPAPSNFFAAGSVYIKYESPIKQIRNEAHDQLSLFFVLADLSEKTPADKSCFSLVDYILEIIIAEAPPPPLQIPAIPNRPFNCCSTELNVTVIRAPLHPIG